jgi:hypothetical protein
MSFGPLPWLQVCGFSAACRPLLPFSVGGGFFFIGVFCHGQSLSLLSSLLLMPRLIVFCSGFLCRCLCGRRQPPAVSAADMSLQPVSVVVVEVVTCRPTAAVSAARSHHGASSLSLRPKVRMLAGKNATGVIANA